MEDKETQNAATVVWKRGYFVVRLCLCIFMFCFILHYLDLHFPVSLIFTDFSFISIYLLNMYIVSLASASQSLGITVILNTGIDYCSSSKHFVMWHGWKIPARSKKNKTKKQQTHNQSLLQSSYNTLHNNSITQ